MSTLTPYYSDESVTLYHGDCREVTAWLDADVLVTDPPYGVAWQGRELSSSATRKRDLSIRGTVSGDNDTAIRDETLRLWCDRPALVFGNWRMARPEGTRQRLIWHKEKSLPAVRQHPWYSAEEEIYVVGDGWSGPPRQNVYGTRERRDGASGEVARIGHPTPKPLGLMEALIRKCPPGVIADPFAGSGSTLIAARNQGRRAIGVEIDERYCEIAARRLAQGVLDFSEVGA